MSSSEQFLNYSIEEQKVLEKYKNRLTDHLWLPDQNSEYLRLLGSFSHRKYPLSSG